MLHELPLVIFTIMAQMSAGAFVALGLINVIGAKAPVDVMEKVTDPAMYAIWPLIILGLVASMAHLGTPLRAANSILHFGGSWLSAEIVAGSTFVGLGIVFAFLQWRKWLAPRLRQALAVVTALVGVVLVYCISQVYSLRTVPAWATFHTPVSFFITAALLGGLAVAVALVFAVGRSQGDPDAEKLLTNSVRGIALASILALGLKFVGQPAYIAYLGTHPSAAAQESLDLLVNSYGAFSAAQNILIFLGVALLSYLLFKMSGSKVNTKLIASIAIAAFVLVFAGEFIGRLLFYASMVRIGV